jgi:hypothetical protein
VWEAVYIIEGLLKNVSGLTDPPGAFDPHLDLHDPLAGNEAPTAHAA